MKENLSLMRRMIKKGLTYQEIGEVFNVSKQRVHQILKNYLPPPYSKNKRKGHKWSFLIGKPCEVCGSDLKVEIHHQDGNRNNNKVDNLQSLCRRHHLEAEKLLRDNGIKTGNRRGKYRQCFVCKKYIWVRPNQRKRGIGKFCSRKCQNTFYKTKPLIHGTYTSYNNKNCRCGKCRKAFTNYRRRLRILKKSKTHLTRTFGMW